MRRQISGLVLVVLFVGSLCTAPLAAQAQQAPPTGAPLYIGNTEGGRIDILDAAGQPIPGSEFGTAFDDDHVAIGNVDDDPEEEVLVADTGGSNDGTGRVDIHLSTFPSLVMDVGDGDDGFVVGNLIDGAPDEVIGADDGSGYEEIIIANANANDGDEGNGRIDIYDATGTPVPGSGFDTNYDDSDGEDKIAIGDVIGGGYEEIVVANTEGNRIDIHELQLPGVNITSFGSAYDSDDGLAVGTGRGGGDLDGDDIPDRVELSGIRNAAGEVVMDLRNVAGNEPASPCRKDIVVEIDWMQGFEPDPPAMGADQPPAIEAIQKAFALAPIDAVEDCPYPGASVEGGINLIVVLSEEIPHQPMLQLPGGFANIKNARFASALDPFVHYNLWADQAQKANGDMDLAGTVNPAQGDPEEEDPQDFLLTLGALNHTPTGDDQASTFMHELGHSIGLHHGGAADNDQGEINCKPNYLSIMNYWFVTGLQGQNVDGSIARRFDFSRLGPEDLPDLKEDSLSEPRGIGAAGRGHFTAWGEDPSSALPGQP